MKNAKDLNLGNNTATFYFKNEIPYAAIPKYYLKDRDLTLKAKGLLTIIYTLPDEWEYNMRGLATVANMSIKSLRPILKELEEKEYIERFRRQDTKGKFYYEYFIKIEPFNY